MSEQIKMSSEKMRERAREMMKQADIFHCVINTMDRSLYTLWAEYESYEKMRIYKDMYDEIKPSFHLIEEILDKIAHELEDMAEIIDCDGRDLFLLGQKFYK